MLEIGDRIFVEVITEPPVTLPDDVMLPACFLVGPERNGHVARINHDPVPRKPGHMTNEIEVCRPLKRDGSGVDPRSKATWQLGNNQEWVDEFVRLNGQWVSDRLFTSGVGWFDTGFPAFSMLDCGGNLVEVLAGGFEFSGWAAINYQDFQSGPYGFDYDVSPHKVTKQVLVGGQNETNILIDKGFPGGYGDTYIPKVANQSIYHSTWAGRDNHNGLKFFPDLPLETRFEVAESVFVDVIVSRYGFHGSNTYVEIGGKWYLGEEMLIIGDYDIDPSMGGTMADRRTYLEALKSMPCPPPVIGWTRQA